MQDDMSAPGAQPLSRGSQTGRSAAEVTAEKMVQLDVQPCGEAITVVVCGEIDARTAWTPR